MNAKESILISQISYAHIGSFIYLTIIRPNVVFSVSLVSHLVQSERKLNLDAAKRILKYIHKFFDISLPLLPSTVHLETQSALAIPTAHPPAYCLYILNPFSLLLSGNFS